jgi:hypothetical protein
MYMAGTLMVGECLLIDFQDCSFLKTAVVGLRSGVTDQTLSKVSQQATGMFFTCLIRLTLSVGVAL